MKTLEVFGLSILFATLIQQGMFSDEEDSLSREESTRLKDLKLDVLFLIFKHLELEDLLSMPGANQSVLILAKEVFMQKFSEHPLEITDSIEVNEERINCLNQKDETQRVLRNFGHLIPNLMIRLHNTINTTEIEQINELISSNCADTLKELSIESSNSYVFDGMIKPFKQLESLSLASEFITLGNSQLNLNALFPAVKNLNMKKIHIDNTSAIIDVFTNLEIVSLRCFHLNDPSHLSEQQFQELLRRNPKIHSLKLNYVNRTLLKIVNDILPNLESLELQIYNPSDNFDAGEIIEFKHVKDLKITHSSVSAPRNIEFPKLLRFSTTGTPFFCNRWVELIEKAPNLEVLFVKTENIYNGQFGRLAEATSNLTEVTIKITEGSMDKMSNEDIMTLVRNNQKLKKMFIFGKEGTKLFESAGALIEREFENKFIIDSCDTALLMVSN